MHEPAEVPPGTVPEGAGVARFGSFRFDLDVGELRRGDEVVPLRPKAAGILRLLVLRAGGLVPRETLLQGVWGDAHIDTDSALHTAIREVRQALDDDAADPRFVATVHRRGYRFVADVELENGSRGPWRPSPGAGRRRERWTRWALVTTVVVVLGGLVGMIVSSGNEGSGPEVAPLPEASSAPFEASDVVLRGRYLVNHGRGQEVVDGVELLRAAVESGDGGVLAWSGLAIGEMKVGRYDTARVAARRALEIEPRSMEALRVLGQISVILGRDLGAAEEALLRALELDPASGRAHHAYAILLMACGRADEAIRMAETSVALVPSSMSARLNLARYRLYARDLDGAIREVREILRRDPNPPYASVARELQAAALWLRGDLAGARDAAVRMIQAEGAPDTLTARLQGTDAVEGFREALEWMVGKLDRLAEESPGYRVRSALFLAQLGEVEQAVLRFRQLGGRSSTLLPFALWDPRLEPLEDHEIVRSLRSRYRMPRAHR